MERCRTLAVCAIVASTLAPLSLRPALAAAEEVLLPDGGRLDALDADGNVLGPCPLRHTEVQASVAGAFCRVSLVQSYHNPYDRKIEAVYTFPLSHRAAVDRMTMTIGDRVVEGEVKERGLARQIYEAAREQGYVASLLEQERPNIFTQSVANIEAGAEIDVEIAYVEVLRPRDGTWSFEFPMVVGPRYIPGSAPVSPALVPAELTVRPGVVLLGPARLRVGAAGAVGELGTLQTGKLGAVLAAARAITAPGDGWWGRGDPTGGAGGPELWYRFEVEYCDGARELGELHTDGTGRLNGRWFYTDPKVIRELGTGFARDTEQVPDASRITPEPVRPDRRAGHDIAVTVTIDTGGPGLVELHSALHEVVQENGAVAEDGRPRAVTVRLARRSELPNRDFVLSWRTAGDDIAAAAFVHNGEHGKYTGGFFTLMIQPPDRVEATAIPPRELIFVMDTSGSMRGFPIDKSKAVMRRALAAMRPEDTFNVITFAGRTDVLWPQPRVVSRANVAAATKFVESQSGRGGTEMMEAIETALRQEEPQGPMRIVLFLTDGYVGNDHAIIDAVRQNARTTRVFSFGIGNSVNRYLLEGMARAGRGEVEFVLLESDADAAVARFTRRVETPVLTDIEVAFDGLDVLDRIPAPGVVPDLFDAQPVVIYGRYRQPRSGTVTIRGRTARGAWERAVPLVLPAEAPDHGVVATLWARERVEQLMSEDLAAAQRGTLPDALRLQVIDLGETFDLMTAYTSFVAVEKTRVTIGGKPVLVAVPIEMPDGVSYEGIFGELVGEKRAVERLGLRSTGAAPIRARATGAKAPGSGAGFGSAGGVDRRRPPGRKRVPPGARRGRPGEGLSGWHQTQNFPWQRGGGGGSIFGDPGDEDEGVMDDLLTSEVGLAILLEDIDGRLEDRNPAPVVLLWKVLVETVRSGDLEPAAVRGIGRKASAPPELERLAVVIAELGEAGRREEAAALARELARHVPAFGAGRPLHEALTAEGLDDAERTQWIDRVLRPVRERIAAVDRGRRPARVLEARLLEASRDPKTLDGLPMRDERLLLCILVVDTDEPTLAALRDAGLDVEAVAAPVRVVVGTATASDLRTLALIDPVRRIEPARME